MQQRLFHLRGMQRRHGYLRALLGDGACAGQLVVLTWLDIGFESGTIHVDLPATRSTTA
ncbi:MAG: hypothetical protein HUU21_14325 [Polyangiaceae bacterium]|nr:hypothetical protein [Polyangiaceae bacterium]NUQ74726.1 hypothetical protein [Polyangiaceae bacterium]